MSELRPVPKPPKRKKKPRKPIRRSRVRQKAGKPKRFAKRRDPEYLAWIRTQDCHMFGRPGSQGCYYWMGEFHGGGRDRMTVEPAHIKTRGAGGDDRNNVVPLCPAHHDEQEGKIAAFERKYGVDLRKLAQQYTERYDRERSVG